MTATEPSIRPDPTRTGTVWVTGTGAFLLLAAASVFVAVHWGEIPDTVKLGVLLLVTGACLLVGRRLKASLPATAGAVFHLGTFLVPVDVTALGVHLGLDWSTLLLAQGLSATLTFGWAAITERSVVLRAAFAVSAVVLAGGIGATTAAPAPLVLATFAVAALGAGRDRLATGWAALAGIAPLLTFVDDLAFEGAGTLERLGLTGQQPRLSAFLTGVAAAGVLSVVGRRRGDAGLVLVGTALGAVGLVASWSGLGVDRGSTLIGLASLFVAVELVTYAARRDPFWNAPVTIVAVVVETLAGVATIGALVPILLAPFTDGTSRPAALALLVLGTGWLVADRRRAPHGSVLAAVGVAICAASAVAAGTPSDPALAITLTAIAGLAVLSGHRAGSTIAVVAATWAPAVVTDATTTLVVVGVLGSVIVAESAVRRASMPAPDQHRADVNEQWAWVLSAVALLPGTLATVAFVSTTDRIVAGLIGAAALATATALVLDRGRVTGAMPLGTLARIAAVAVLAGTTELPAGQVAVVAAAVAGLSIADALRQREPHIALGASLAVPVVLGALVRSTGLSLPASGVALTLGAAVLVGLGSLVDRRWALPFLVAAGLSAGVGLAMASHDATAFADALMITSGIGLAISVERGRLDGVVVAWLGLTAGIWLRLADSAVTATEPYLAPAALLLLGAGLRARSTGTSSWIAYGPVVTVFGGAALAERMAGGPGWHALVAGTVGVLAVAAGGYRRLAGPLLLGTGLLVALVGYETLAITAALPTRVWLAAGGTALLATGVAMERQDLSPIETGKRLVDVIDDKFA